MGKISVNETYLYQSYHTISPILSPIRGGAIIGVFMIQAQRGAFMGYIGLLLNAPYKIG
jgi:hypothetical protein